MRSSVKRLAGTTIALLAAATAAAAASDGASGAALADGPTTTVCFLLPIEPGQTTSEQWCARAPAGTPLAVILADAPGRGEGGIGDVSAADWISLGWDYDGFYKSGDSLQWTATGTCSGGSQWAGNTPDWFRNRASSATISSGNGCGAFWHYDLPNRQGDSLYCTATNCDDAEMYYRAPWLNNRTESVLFSA